MVSAVPAFASSLLWTSLEKETLKIHALLKTRSNKKSVRRGGEGRQERAFGGKAEHIIPRDCAVKLLFV